MTPSELKQALRIRRLRESRAERALLAARRVEADALAALNTAHVQLDAFDERLASQMNAFMERSMSGVNPAAVQAMKGFHADQMTLRVSYVDAIASAEQLLATARAQTQQARAVWQKKSNAAENIQTLSDKSDLVERREGARRAELEIDETFGALSARRARG